MRTTWRTIHIAPHFHHDVAYLQSEAECLRAVLPNLVRALDLLDEHPDYCFMVEQMYLLEQLLCRRPGERERVCRHLASGRLEIAGGLYVMADLNLISGESIVAQIRLGREIAATLGLPSLEGKIRVCWISDCWGHPFQMPQIAQGCGYEGYAFCRGMLRADDGSNDEPLLHSEFLWLGPANSSVIGLWLPEGYGPVPFLPDWFGNAGPPGVTDVMQRIADRVGRYSSLPVVLLGNGGDNAPPQASLLQVCRASETMRISTPNRYLDDVVPFREQLQRFSGEFNSLFQGTYSAQIPIKQRNRQLEHLLETVRRYRAACGEHRRSVDEQVRHAERLIAKQQVHDVIAGSICDDVHKDVMREFEEAEEMLLAAGRLVPRQALPSMDQQHWFNPSTFPRTELIDTRWRCEGIALADGTPLPVQQAFDGRALCVATVPALSTVSLSPGTSQAEAPTALRVNGEVIENRYWLITLSPGGGIASVKSKATGQEFVDRRRCEWNALVFQWDMGDVYMHDAQPLDTRSRASWFASPHVDPLPPVHTESLQQTCARYSVQEECHVELLESGPLRVLVCVTGKISVWRVAIPFAQYIAIYPDDPRIDFHTEIVPQGKHFRLRVAFPTTVRGGRCRHEVPFGYIERAEGEHPALHWIDYRNADYGVCLINYGLPGNAVWDDVLLLSLFRSVALEYKCQSELAFGSNRRHWFDYAVIPIDGVAPYEPVRSGEQVNRPLCPVQEAAPVPALRVDSETVVLSLWDGRVLRLYQASEKPGLARITFPADCRLIETDLLGKARQTVDTTDGIARLAFEPFQIRTFRMEPGSGG